MERELAKIKRADIQDVYNGMLGLVVEFEYEDEMHQCLSGYMLDAAMVVRVMSAVGANALSKMEGLSCWVTHDNSSIIMIEPLHKKEGKPFVLDEWKRWLKRHNVKSCWSDLIGDMNDEQYSEWLNRHGE